jgi:hypothetical protein
MLRGKKPSISLNDRMRNNTITISNKTTAALCLSTHARALNLTNTLHPDSRSGNGGKWSMSAGMSGNVNVDIGMHTRKET